MTLTAMASFVGSKVRQTDAAALTRCKAFLKQRYEMIWNEGLWRASVFGHDFTFDPALAVSSPMPAFGNYYTMRAGNVSLPSSVDRVLALRTDDRTVWVEQAETLYRTSVDEFEQTGEPVKFLILPAVVADLSAAAVADRVAAAPIFVTSSDFTADDGTEVRIKMIDQDGEETHETVTIALATVGGFMTKYPKFVLSVSKGATTGEVVLALEGNFIATLQPEDLVSKRFPRIRPVPTPTASKDFKVLVKKKPSPLDEDADEPELMGAENCLMSFAQADMLQHARQYAKAQVVAQEALALLNQFKSMELIQQATRRQVTPETEGVSGDFEMSKAWYL